jgi:hypothetical protein
MVFTKPTKEQLERLALIPDPDQRQTLLAAIQRGEDIPEYAWKPIDMRLLDDPRIASLHTELADYARDSNRDLSEVIASMDPVTLIQHFAQRARLAATKESGFLCSPPFVVRPFLEESPSCTGLSVWGIFNPYGPTLWGLVLIDVPGKGESLLYSVVLNPFYRKDVVYGLLPLQLALDELTVILRRLFHSHAMGPHALMPDCLPSFVIPGYTGEDWNQAGLIFCEALTHIAADDVMQFCRDEMGLVSKNSDQLSSGNGR